MGFRKFTEYGAASRKQLSLRANSVLFVSKNILNQIDQLDSNFVVIFINEETLDVGLKFLKDDPKGARRKLTKESAGVSLNISPVLKCLGIKKFKKGVSIDFEKGDEMLIFSLKSYVKE